MKILLILLISYAVGINLFGFILMGVDKHKAERNAWRISEVTLFMAAVFGGSVGCMVGMRVFHHKTKHWKFLIGMPLIFILESAALLILWFNLPDITFM
ncbi:MAG: DUF1294 domain-containing protein [Lachnospiraceae bacterium]|nr:DUF1294 domain-containing protein [Lachnospiraceae bacterium]